jgi:hypothetical protein
MHTSLLRVSLCLQSPLYSPLSVASGWSPCLRGSFWSAGFPVNTKDQSGYATSSTTAGSVVRQALSFHRVFYIPHRIKLALTSVKNWVFQRFERPVPAPGQTASWNSLGHASSPIYANVSPRHAVPSDTTSSQSDPTADVPIATSDTQGTRPSTVVVSPRRARFAQALRSMMAKQTGVFTRQQATQHPTPARFAPAESRQEELRGVIRSSRVARLAPSLKVLSPTLDITVHQALVRQLQFSPNGKFLATSR